MNGQYVATIGKTMDSKQKILFHIIQLFDVSLII